jgi:hypothetical protein
MPPKSIDGEITEADFKDIVEYHTTLPPAQHHLWLSFFSDDRSRVLFGIKYKNARRKELSRLARTPGGPPADQLAAFRMRYPEDLTPIPPTPQDARELLFPRTEEAAKYQPAIDRLSRIKLRFDAPWSIDPLNSWEQEVTMVFVDNSKGTVQGDLAGVFKEYLRKTLCGVHAHEHMELREYYMAFQEFATRIRARLSNEGESVQDFMSYVDMIKDEYFDSMDKWAHVQRLTRPENGPMPLAPLPRGATGPPGFDRTHSQQANGRRGRVHTDVEQPQDSDDRTSRCYCCGRKEDEKHPQSGLQCPYSGHPDSNMNPNTTWLQEKGRSTVTTAVLLLESERSVPKWI